MIKNELISVIIRTLNEERYLEELLQKIKSQILPTFTLEIVLVDSGSTDRTLDIAQNHGCIITYIRKSDFTFGRSLNFGCKAASGKYLVFISGHCIPVDNHWLENLVLPLKKGLISYVYGKQVGRDSTKFSERQLFSKYFPDEDKLPQKGIFCNNANSALLKEVWLKKPFNEELTGCEDMFLAKEIVQDGHQIGYTGKSTVFHIHDETWERVKIRYEREAIALQRILPNVHFSFWDMVLFISVGIFKDACIAAKEKVFIKEFTSIVKFRIAQYYGAYLGNKKHRKLSRRTKLKYFYPIASNMEITANDLPEDIKND